MRMIIRVALLVVAVYLLAVLTDAPLLVGVTLLEPC